MRASRAQAPQILDRVVILEHEGRTAEVLPIQEIDAERIVAPGHVIPRKDARQYITPRGTLWVLSAPSWYVDETRHLAEVEMASVIRQAVNYQRPGAARPAQPRWASVLPWILAAVLAVLVVLRV
ncbi:MAG: hypothetical protein K6T57_15675 [Thermaceae bacterium]|nr:hypothetical protein [Thermaceae bacterium]